MTIDCAGFTFIYNGKRDHSGIFIISSKNFILENINMNDNSGISFLAQFPENIAFRNVSCIPNSKKRKIISGHDGGFHISNCKGEIVADNCRLKFNG